LLSIQSLGLKVTCVGVNHRNGYKLFFNLSFHAFVRTSQEMWLLFGRSKLLGQCVAKWNDHHVDQLWSQHSNPNFIRPWFGYVINWLGVTTNHSYFGTRSLHFHTWKHHASLNEIAQEKILSLSTPTHCNYY